jgi:hypothetical protein
VPHAPAFIVGIACAAGNTSEYETTAVSPGQSYPACSGRVSMSRPTILYIRLGDLDCCLNCVSRPVKIWDVAAMTNTNITIAIINSTKVKPSLRLINSASLSGW